ncbi:hypothetical protein GGU11DRAFT_837932 [Lentinula aff. detonsa]|nr:hypothetical protein GGU11DRAFT_837932 [Lentinula aff. detonsa]
MITDSTIRSILQLNADLASGKVSTTTTMLPEHWDVIVRAFNAENLEEKFVVIRNDNSFDHVNIPAREGTIFGEVPHTYQDSPAWSSISQSVSTVSQDHDMGVDHMDNTTETFDATMPSFALQPTGQSIAGQQTGDFSIYGSMHAPGGTITPSRILTDSSCTQASPTPGNLHFSNGNAGYDKREKLQNRVGPIRNNKCFHRAQERKQYLHLQKQSAHNEKLLTRAKEVMFMKALRDHEAMERNRQKKDERKRVKEKELSREEDIDDFLSSDEYSENGSNDAGPSFAK